MTMAPEQSAHIFGERYVSPEEMDSLPTRSLLASVFQFYRNERPQDVDDAEGDMLLFQYGIYDWGSGPFFEIDLTRQFVELERDDDENVFSQFHLTCHFVADQELTALGKGSRWCTDVSGLDQFALWVDLHPVLAAVDGRSRFKAEVTWELV